MIRTVIFDIGNVLMKFDWIHWIRTIFDEETASAVSRAFWEDGKWEGMDKGTVKPWQLLSSAISAYPEYEKQIREAFDRVGECMYPFEYAIPWVKEVKALGYQVLYLSNYSRYLRRLKPEVLNFLPEMDGGVFSCDVHMIKPDAQIYAKICADYDLDPSECLFIDDTEVNIRAAEQYGMHAIRFQNYEATYPKIMAFLKRSRIGRPVIGVLPMWDEENAALWMLPGYMEGIQEAGGLPVMLPLTKDEDQIRQMAEMCDGFLFTGGQDVAPEVYEQPYRVDNIITCPARDAMEEPLLALLLKMDKPILGIGRGMQFINGALGGDLYQDIPTEFLSVVEHRQQSPYDMPVHTVKVMMGTPLYDLLSKDTLTVNSCHHQGIRKTSFALRSMAYSLDDQLCEAVYMPGKKFLWGVQWHPEADYGKNENDRKILQALVDAAGM